MYEKSINNHMLYVLYNVTNMPYEDHFCLYFCPTLLA